MLPRQSNFALVAAMASLLMLNSSTFAVDVVFVDEDFESYANSTALYSVWGPNDGSGTLVDETFEEFLTLDDIEPIDVGNDAFPSGGQGVHHFGGSVLTYQPTLNGGSPIEPTESQSIVLQADIFDVGVIGNKRMSVGLRSTTPDNIVEIGHWNESPVELAGRVILFGEPAIAEQPNWQFYELPTEFDSDDEDTITTLGEIGEAWHTHKVTITPTTVTFEIDLLRDGLDAATGLPGFDASMSFDVEPTASGFDELRLGSPSGVVSGGNGFYGGVIFDNISLKLVDNLVTTPLTGDYNGDSVVDAADYTVYRDTLGDSVTVGEGADGNGNGVVDPGDYDVWVANYGTSSSSASAAAVPEPSSLLVLLTCTALLATRARGTKE